jgi:hypothetical protein
MRSRLAMAAAAAVLVLVAGRAFAQDMDLMQYADTNSDGKITPAEYSAFLEQAWGYFAMGADKVKLADLDPMAKPLFAGLTPDADGTVSKAAFLATAPAKFKAADKNGDGTLDKDELNGSVKSPG